MTAFRFGGLIVAVLLGYSVSTRASTILALLWHDVAVIAADAKVRGMEDNDIRTACKIFDVGNGMVFAVTGVGTFKDPTFVSYTLARAIATQSSDVADAAIRYGEIAKPILTAIWRKLGTQFRKMLLHPQAYIFVMVKPGGITASSGSFVETPDGSLRLKLNHGKITRDEFRFIKMGFTSSIPSSEEVHELVRRQGVQTTAEQLILQQAAQTPDRVGGPVTVVRLDQRLGIQWLQPGVCQAGGVSPTQVPEVTPDLK